jgi:uncharacterized membrane protein
MSSHSLKSPVQLLKESSAAVRRNLTLFIFLNAVGILGTAWDIGLDIRDKSKGSSLQQVFTHTFTGSGSDQGLNGAVVLIFVLAGIVLYLLAAILTVLAAKKQTVKFDEVWRIFKDKWLKIIGVELLVVLLVVVGCVFLLIPGLYLLGRLAIAPALLIDQDVGIMDAMNASWEYTRGKAWPVFVAFFFGALLSVTSVIPFIGPIVATALSIAYSVAIPIRYFELKKLSVNG